MKKQDLTSSRKVNKCNEQEHNYYIVEFEDGLQIIPHNWLIDDKQAFWPPFHNWKMYYNAVKKMQKPLDWKTFTIKIIGSASTFDRAMDKLSMAEKTSDIFTDSDCNVAKKKRRRHAQKVLSSEIENSDSDEELSMNKYLSPLPMPLQARYGKRSALNIGSSSKACATQPNTDARNNEENIDLSFDTNKQLSPLPMPLQARYSKKSALNIGSSSKACPTHPNTDARNNQENIDVSFDTNKQLSLLPMPPQARYGKRSASNMSLYSKTYATQSNTDARNDHENIDAFCDKNCNSCKVMLSFQQDILKLAVENSLRGKKFETMLQNIMDKVTNQDTTTSISDILNSDIDFYPQYLPAQTLADFHTAEDKWKTDKEYREHVVQLFIKCKGADIKNTTYTIMENLMSHNVAMLYSWTGAKQNKEKFSKSPFHTVLQTTIMQLHNDATLQGIKKCITDWLRHAKESHVRNSTDNE